MGRNKKKVQGRHVGGTWKGGNPKKNGRNVYAKKREKRMNERQDRRGQPRPENGLYVDGEETLNGENNLTWTIFVKGFPH